MSYQCLGSKAALASCAEFIKIGKWGVIGVHDASDPFYYTVGLHSLGLPELILFGPFRPELATALVNTAAEYMAENNVVFIPGMVQRADGGLFNLDTMFARTLPSANSSFCVQLFEFYQTKNIEVMQMIWPDTQAKFPWDVGSEFLPGMQFHNRQKLICHIP